MEPFKTLTAIAAPMPLKNVDTDYIIRVERCAQTPWDQLGQYAFEMARFLPDGGENPAFVLNQPRYRGAQILLCGEFFGTGSSREMAVWAIAGIGIRCLIAPSFGQIFYSNCFQNGVLPIVLPAATVDALMAEATAPGAKPFTVDLDRQLINGKVAFEVTPRRRKMLMEGLDELGFTLTMAPKIDAFQAEDRKRRPWIYAGF